MTDDLLQAVRDLPKVSPYLHVPVQSGSNEQLQADEAGLHGRVLSRDDRADPLDRSRCGHHQRLHRRLLRRDGGGFPAVGRTGSLGPLQEQLHFQVQRAPRDEGRRRHARRRAGRSQAAAEQRASGRAERHQPGGQPARWWAAMSRCWWRVPASPRRSGPAAATTCVQLVGRSVRDHIVVFDGPRTLVGQILPVRIEKADAFTLYGRL